MVSTVTVIASALITASLSLVASSPAIAAENPASPVTTIVLTNDAPKTTTLASSATDTKIGTESIHPDRENEGLRRLAHGPEFDSS